MSGEPHPPKVIESPEPTVIDHPLQIHSLCLAFDLLSYHPLRIFFTHVWCPY